MLQFHAKTPLGQNQWYTYLHSIEQRSSEVRIWVKSVQNCTASLYKTAPTAQIPPHSCWYKLKLQHILSQEWFTSRNLELCAWQRSISLGTSFDLGTLRRSPKTCSGYSHSRLCHNIDIFKVSTPAKIGFGYSYIWLVMIWICLLSFNMCIICRDSEKGLQ